MQGEISIVSVEAQFLDYPPFPENSVILGKYEDQAYSKVFITSIIQIYIQITITQMAYNVAYSWMWWHTL